VLTSRSFRQPSQSFCWTTHLPTSRKTYNWMIVRDWLNDTFTHWNGRWGHVRWSPRSPDLSPLDFRGMIRESALDEDYKFKPHERTYYQSVCWNWRQCRTIPSKPPKLCKAHPIMHWKWLKSCWKCYLSTLELNKNAFLKKECVFNHLPSFCVFHM